MPALTFPHLDILGAPARASFPVIQILAAPARASLPIHPAHDPAAEFRADFRRNVARLIAGPAVTTDTTTNGDLDR
jgi:hypothetical protein